MRLGRVLGVQIDVGEELVARADRQRFGAFGEEDLVQAFAGALQRAFAAEDRPFGCA